MLQSKICLWSRFLSGRDTDPNKACSRTAGHSSRSRISDPFLIVYIRTTWAVKGHERPFRALCLDCFGFTLQLRGTRAPSCLLTGRSVSDRWALNGSHGAYSKLYLRPTWRSMGSLQDSWLLSSDHSMGSETTPSSPALSSSRFSFVRG
jgi:hypothetical protein